MEHNMQITVSLAEVTQLQSDNDALKSQVVDLQEENESLKKQLYDLNDSSVKATAAVFRRSRGR